MTYRIIAQRGSVKVPELCAVYSFLQVHQMISTVTSKLDPQYSAIEAIKKSFPMGSMMDQKFGDENHRGIRRDKRGMYSGAVGYFLWRF
jgi:para-aminobenzoate synthetase component 1